MEDEMLNIDNNPLESSIRPIALGRRNFLFSGSHDGAQRSAMLYSFMGSCKLHGINPMIWLEDVLIKLSNNPTQPIQKYLPHNWKKSQIVETENQTELAVNIA